MKVVLAGVLGGLVLFLWSAVSHMATPLGSAGFRSIPAEREVLLGEAMKVAMNERALYFFPAGDMENMSEADRLARDEKVKNGPSAIIVYMPRDAATLGPKALLSELFTNILVCCLAACVLANVPASVGFMKRALMVAAFGAFAALEVDASHWIWHSFPTPYFLAQVVDHTVGAFLAGLVIAKIAK